VQAITPNKNPSEAIIKQAFLALFSERPFEGGATLNVLTRRERRHDYNSQVIVCSFIAVSGPLDELFP